MQIIGFQLNKINAEKSPEFKKQTNNRMNIEFIEIQKQDASIIPEKETIVISFQYLLEYYSQEKKKEETQASIKFEGKIIIAADKNESKDILNTWKKKKLSDQFKVILFNIILRKCSTKALLLEEELNLPSHLPLPMVSQIKPSDEEK